MKTNVQKIFDFLEISNKLKETKRWKTITQIPEKESSADHSWHLALLVWIVGEVLELKVDLAHSIRLALVHDLVEALADDVESYRIIFGLASKKDKDEKELQAIKKISKILPNKSGKYIFELWSEYESAKTKEAKFVMAMDKIESIIHMLMLGHEHFHYADIIGTYSNDAVRDFPSLKPFFQELKERLKPEYAKHGWKWKEEYEIRPIESSNKKQEIDKIYDFVIYSFQLKGTKRWLKTPQMIDKETTASHTWQMTLLGMISCIELELKMDLDMVIKICLVHDLAELICGDVDSSLIYLGIDTKEAKHKRELLAINEIVRPLPKKIAKEIFDLWSDYEDPKSFEARYTKAIDKVEGIEHMVCIGPLCFDHPEWIAPHPQKAVEKCPETIPLYKELLKRLKPMYEEMGWEWKTSYEVSEMDGELSE